MIKHWGSRLITQIKGQRPALEGGLADKRRLLARRPEELCPLVFQSHLLKSERIRARVLMKCHMLLQGRTVPG